ncbi:Sigma factor PP2C-like phosphatase [Fragilaria crotonensis]|nr:Sigma factor PP2C-like phosphatase [Fragilaria crotonensis]
MGNILELDHVTKKTSEQGAGGQFRYATSGMKGWRVTMEDCHTICLAIPVDGYDGLLDDHALFAVYDGHGGDLTSLYAGENFVKILSRRSEMKKYANLRKEGHKSRSDVTGIDLLRTALKTTFKELDSELRRLHIDKNEEYARVEEAFKAKAKEGPLTDDVLAQLEGNARKVERSGSTCVVVLITPSHIMCANAGDSRAILRRGGKAFPLSFDHKPSNLPEHERILNAGGFVKAKRVDGDLAVSRGLGDFSFKGHCDLPHHKQKVIFEPDVLVYPREGQNDEFVVLACDGIWDVVSNGECSDMIQAILDEGETDMALVCEEVLDMCLEKNSRDNMTIVIVGFPGIKMANASHKSSNVVLNRRASRRARILEAHAKAAAASTAKSMGLKFGLSSNNPGSNGLPPKKSEIESTGALRLDAPGLTTV